MNYIIGDLLDVPHISKETDYQNFLGEETHVVSSAEKMKELEYTLSYDDKFLIGVDFDTREILLAGHINWDLKNRVEENRYDTNSKFESIVENLRDVLAQKYVNVEKDNVVSYNPNSEKLYKLNLCDGYLEVDDLAEIARYISYNTLDEPISAYGLDLGDLYVIFESGMWEWSVLTYVFEGGVIEIGRQIEDECVSEIMYRFNPIIHDDGVSHHLRHLDNLEDGEVIYKSESAMAGLMSDVL